MKMFGTGNMGKGAVFAGAAWITAAWMLSAAPGIAQTEGVSKPMPVTMASPDEAEVQSAPAAEAPAAKPSAAIPATAQTVYAPYNPATDVHQPVVSDEVVLHRKAPNDPDAGIVTYVPSEPGEIPDGTLIKARLRETLSTVTTRPGTAFSAEVTEPVMRDGRVVVPTGAVLEGRVTMVRGGKRVSGGAAIHLETRTVTMPDGTQYAVHARVIDTSSWDNTKVDSEGTISRREAGKGTAAIMGLTTGGGAAAGAMMAGVPGALIGAGVGAGVSTIVWLKQDRQAELPKDLGLVFSLTLPMMVKPVTAGLPVTARTGGE